MDVTIRTFLTASLQIVTVASISLEMKSANKLNVQYVRMVSGWIHTKKKKKLWGIIA